MFNLAVITVAIALVALEIKAIVREEMIRLGAELVFCCCAVFLLCILPWYVKLLVLLAIWLYSAKANLGRFWP